MNWKVVDRIFVVIGLIVFGYLFFFSSTNHPYQPFYSEYNAVIAGLIGFIVVTFPYFAIRYIFGAWKSK